MGGMKERGLIGRNMEGRNSRKQGDKGSREAGIDVHVGIQGRGVLDAELDDVTEAHGDFGLCIGKFHQWISEAKAKGLWSDVRI